MQKNDNQALIDKLNALPGLTAEEKAELTRLLQHAKKYGLVWEDKPEAVEYELKTRLPVLDEVQERFVEGCPPASPQTPTSPAPAPSVMFADNDEASTTDNPRPEKPEHKPDHILIEGDNLHALTALTFTHENRIDLIYIDPPYNTGNKDFKYNDRFVDREDSYRHSKWLSFMEKRLRIAKRLLKDTGVIVIHIDEYEFDTLSVLLKYEIFF
jgi:adenine-specific DNA-methyltransferase